MGKVETTFKCTPLHWTNGSFLICRKILSRSFNGVEYIFYEPIERWIGDGIKSTNTHKGCHFTSNEFSSITPIT